MLKIGDSVTYRIPGRLGNIAFEEEQMLVIGQPHHSKNWSHVVLSDEDATGMPINAAHCEVTGYDVLEAMRLRARYEAAFPGFLTPLSVAEELERGFV